MAKDDEVNYIQKVVQVEGVDRSQFLDYLIKKPFSDNQCWLYLIDIGQILKLLPPKPARLLDLGVGSGWTSEIFGRCGYSVTGIDISPDMIALSRKRNEHANLSNVEFFLADFEKPFPFMPFDAAISYDALHHAENEGLVMQRVYEVLKPSGVLVMVEPGEGHSRAEYSVHARKKFGTTEKDLPFDYIEPLLKKIGFKGISQYLRIGFLDLMDMAGVSSLRQQIRAVEGLSRNTTESGLSSIIVARKGESV